MSTSGEAKFCPGGTRCILTRRGRTPAGGGPDCPKRNSRSVTPGARGDRAGGQRDARPGRLHVRRALPAGTKPEPRTPYGRSRRSAPVPSPSGRPRRSGRRRVDVRRGPRRIRRAGRVRGQRRLDRAASAPLDRAAPRRAHLPRDRAQPRFSRCGTPPGCSATGGGPSTSLRSPGTGGVPRIRPARAGQGGGRGDRQAPRGRTRRQADYRLTLSSRASSRPRRARGAAWARSRHDGRADVPGHPLHPQWVTAGRRRAGSRSLPRHGPATSPASRSRGRRGVEHSRAAPGSLPRIPRLLDQDHRSDSPRQIILDVAGFDPLGELGAMNARS